MVPPAFVVVGPGGIVLVPVEIMMSMTVCRRAATASRWRTREPDFFLGGNDDEITSRVGTRLPASHSVGIA